MASETVDPIDWSHPLPYTGQYSPELHVLHTAMRAQLQTVRLTALNQPRTCDLWSASSMHCLCGHSGYKVYSWWHCWKLCADTDGNSARVLISPRQAPISPCQAPISPCWVPMLPRRAPMRRCLRIERQYRHIEWRVFESFMIFHYVLRMFHDVLHVARFITMFYKSFIMFYFV